MAEGRFSELTGTQAPDEARARRAILRSVLIWTPVFALLTVGAVYMMVEALGGNGGSWFGFSLFALIGLLSGFSALSAFRDWFSAPIETTGQVARKWRKFDLLIFFRAHYVLVARRVFRVPRLVFEEMPESGGWIYLHHYPHTNALIAWRPLSEGERLAEADESESRASDWEERRRERAAEAVAASAARRGESDDAGERRRRVELPTFGERRDD